eukprot:982910-Amphidinium_carterae.1
MLKSLSFLQVSFNFVFYLDLGSSTYNFTPRPSRSYMTNKRVAYHAAYVEEFAAEDAMSPTAARLTT